MSTIPDEMKLIALKCALAKNTQILSESWNFSKEAARKKFESRGESKTELELALDAYAAFTFACGMTALELLERERLIVISPTRKTEVACKLAATPLGILATKIAIDEILSIAEKKGAEVKVEGEHNG